MQEFSVTFSRNTAILLILSVIPVTFILGIVLPLGLWPELSDWAPLILAVVTVGISLVAVRLLYLRYAAIPAVVLLDEAGIAIRLQRPSPFYQMEYSATWDNISNVSSNVESRQLRRFYVISFRSSGKTVQLIPDEYADESLETAFGEALLSFVGHYNEQQVSAPEKLIRRRGFYQAFWSKALTVLAMIACFLGPGLYFGASDKIHGWHAWLILSFGLTWLGVYYVIRYKAKS